LIQAVIEMTIEPVLNDSQLEVVGNLAYEIWNGKSYLIILSS
jgi:hypothetical protein